MADFQVIVTDFIDEPLEIERAVLGDIADIMALGATSNADLDSRIEEADALMVYHFVSVEQAAMQRMPKLKIVARCGAGFDNVDRVYARSQQIAVTNVPDYGTEDVADAAIAMVLSLARGTHRLSLIGQRSTGKWDYEPAVPLRRIRGQTFGVLGLGRIGTAAALRAKAFGLNVVFYDPYVADGVDKALGVSRVESFDEFLGRSNVVSCHCLLTEETRHIINPASIELMPPGSILVNTARGAVVDPMAVLKGLESGRLMGAGIDVLEHEPPDDQHPLLKAWRDSAHPAQDRLILTPHAAFYCEEGLADMRRKASENVRRVLLGQPCRNVVS